MNRIIAAYGRMEKQIAQRIKDGLTTVEKVEQTCKALDMDLEEYCRFQELKSLAVASEKLTLEEGMTIYSSLGETLSVFNNQPVHVKSALTSLFKELLTWQIHEKKKM